MESSDEVEEKVRSVLAGFKSLYLSTTASDVPWGAGAFSPSSTPSRW
ncbi:MAG: hypothetical protein M3141_06935 [Actinomycetota bacterium]|nr:hypothetical protein [Actinomycetota bacterium]